MDESITPSGQAWAVSVLSFPSRALAQCQRESEAEVQRLGKGRGVLNTRRPWPHPLTLEGVLFPHKGRAVGVTPFIR